MILICIIYFSIQLGPLLLAVYQQIRLPERYLSGLDREQCEICGAHVEILKREAVLALHSVSVAPQLAQPQVQHSGIPVSHSRNSNSAHTCNNNMMVGNSDIQGTLMFDTTLFFMF